MEELDAVRRLLDQKNREAEDAKRKNQRLQVGND